VFCHKKFHVLRLLIAIKTITLIILWIIRKKIIRIWKYLLIDRWWISQNFITNLPYFNKRPPANWRSYIISHIQPVIAMINILWQNKPIIISACACSVMSIIIQNKQNKLQTPYYMSAEIRQITRLATIWINKERYELIMRWPNVWENVWINIKFTNELVSFFSVLQMGWLVILLLPGPGKQKVRLMFITRFYTCYKHRISRNLIPNIHINICVFI